MFDICVRILLTDVAAFMHMAAGFRVLKTITTTSFSTVTFSKFYTPTKLHSKYWFDLPRCMM
jgi:hypothetical protein